jgi:mono/diheme cytochrome c family protein
MVKAGPQAMAGRARSLLWAIAALAAVVAGVPAALLLLDRAAPVADATAATADATAIATATATATGTGTGAAAGAASPATAAPAAGADLIERGRVLALAGNCAGCHTARGGAPYAGGRAIATPFGTVYAGNLTPDAATGLGRWTAGHFWRALHEGRGLDGRRLVPVFPYTETTRITRADSDALFAWLRTLAPVAQAAPAHALRWPYGTQPALAAWRLAFFRAGEWRDDAAQGAEWNRGAYLVNGAGHCVACHGGRNALGATADAGFGGGLVPTRNWYAPAFTRADEASVADWPLDEIVALLRSGVAPRGRASGPMAEVVVQSTQHLPQADLQAMALYLKSLPVSAPPARGVREAAAAAEIAPRVARGAALYRDHCAACHGDSGEGGVLAPAQGDAAATAAASASATAATATATASNATHSPANAATATATTATATAPGPASVLPVPALAGNRLVTMDPPANLVRAITGGGFGAVTAANPRPFGMPPFAHVLNDAQVGDLATFLRSSWGAQSTPLNAVDVARWRGGSEP